MAKIFAAFADGWGRVLRAPAILFGAFAVTWLVAFPAGRIMDQPVRAAALSRTDAADALAGGFDRTFTPTLLGADRLVLGVRGFLADGTLPVEIAAAAATTLLVWTFLLGGILDRYARRRPIRTQAFFGASGVFFFRFLRLGVIASAGYYLLFGLIHPLIFLPSYRWVTSDAAAGTTTVPLLVFPLYAAFLAVASFWSAVVDYARIRAVVEDRRSMLGAFLAGWRFIVRHPMKTGGLYVLNAAAFGVLLGVNAIAFPFTPEAGAAGFAALAAANLFLLARLAFKLAFFASQTALFQRSLAHAEYTAAPPVLWPESPAAEEIINAAATRPPQP
ncbi:MAG: hypothetical protein R6V57_17445 [Vicinamibacterales bacterium]